MNIAHTLNAIEDFIEEELNTFRFDTKVENVKRSPQVYQGYIPPKKNTKERNNNDEDDIYPHVMIRFIQKKSSAQDGSIAVFRVYIGTYSKDIVNGWRDPLIIMEVLERRLIERQDIGASTLVGEIDYYLFEEQAEPFYHGFMEFTLKLPTINNNKDTEGSNVLDDYIFED